MPSLPLKNQNPGRTAGWWVALVLLSLMGFAMGLNMNRNGVDVEPDSAVYMTSGILFAHGEGMSMPNRLGPPQPMVWFPPLTPWMVSLCEWSKLDIRKTFGVFDALTWATLIAWIGWLARRSTNKCSAMGLFAAGVILTSAPIALVNGFLYSEPPFLLCLVGFLASLAKWCEQKHLRWIVAAGLCAGVSLLARYVGLTLLLTGGLVILVSAGSVAKKLPSLILFGLPGTGPMAAWHLWQKILRSAPSAERTLAWHPIRWDQINDGIATISSFVIPPSLAESPRATWVIVGIFMLLIVVAIFRAMGRTDGSLRAKLSTVPPIIGISAAFIAIYLAFLVLSISIADAETPLDGRILCIIVPPGAIIAAYLAFAAIWERGQLWLRGTFATIAYIMLAALGLFTFRDQVCRAKIYCPPVFYSDTLESLRSIPQDAIVFTSAPCEVYMATRIKSEDLPHPPPEDGWHNGGKKDFDGEVEAMKQKLAPHGGWVLYWDGLDGAPAIPQEELEKLLPVAETRTFADGALLRIAPAH